MWPNARVTQIWPFGFILFISMIGVLTAISQGIIEKILTIKTCGKPNIQNIMNNVTVHPGQSATFKCQVDMSCIVAYIEWYHEMDNGTEKLIKTASSSGDPHTHNIKKVAATDEGLYTCVAGNVLGQAVASAYLEVNSANRPFALTPAKLFVQTTKHIQMHPFSTATTLLVLSTIYAQINRHAWPWFSI